MCEFFKSLPGEGGNLGQDTRGKEHLPKTEAEKSSQEDEVDNTEERHHG